MLGFENTFTIEKKTEGLYGTVKQEVRVIDGSIFLAHWHIEEQYWSYDQLSKQLMEAYDFSVPKRELLLSIWDNLEDVILSINQLKIEGDCLEKLECGELTIKHTTR